MRLNLLLLPTTLLAAACADPSERIAAELVAYGLEEGQAQCVGTRLENDLSTDQLKQLAAAARAFKQNDTSPGRLTSADLLRVAARIDDPKVPIEVGRAAAGCGLIASQFGL